jgi:predicted Ser/Thr protein kinase
MTHRWLELVQTFDWGNLRRIPDWEIAPIEANKGTHYKADSLSDNGISMVYRITVFNNAREEGTFILKRSIPYLIENEAAFLNVMQYSGYVPRFDRYDKYTLRIEDLGHSEQVTDWKVFRENCANLLYALKTHSVRHGDITEQAVIISYNKPHLIDFAESRWKFDPAPNKQRKSDTELMSEFIKRLAAKANA